MDEAELTELFRRLGAPDPESWARSQIREGIPQLARYVFLRQAWKQVVRGGDNAWMSELRRYEKYYPKLLAAIDRVIDAGASEDDLTIIVRGMQAQTLFGMCHLIDDPGDLEPEVADMNWALFRIDENGRPIEEIDGLHESTGSTDPDGVR